MNNNINNFLGLSVESGNKARSRVTLAKIDRTDKSKDAARSAKQSLAVYNPLNEFLKVVINNAHNELTGKQKHKVLLSELLANLDNLLVNGKLPETTNKAVKKLSVMFPLDEVNTVNFGDVVSNIAKAIRNYRAFTAEASNNAIKAKVEKDADFSAKLLDVSFMAFQYNEANKPLVLAENSEVAGEAEEVKTMAASA